MERIHKIGKIMLVFGVIMLAGGIATGLMAATVITPVLISGSILINSIGITMLRYNK